MKFYAQIISTADSKPYVVEEKEFETKAEAAAYALGVMDAIRETDPDNDDLSPNIALEPAEDE